MDTENILKDIEAETKKAEKWGSKKVSEKDYLIAIIIVSVIAISFFVYVNFMPKSFFMASAELIEIKGCDECFDTKSLAEGIIKRNYNINIDKKAIDYNSKEAKSLIEKYKIERAPALIILSKDLEKIDLVDEQTFLTRDDYAIFDKAVPYIDLSSGDIKGIISLKEIYDSSCNDCTPLSQVKEQLKNIGVKFKDYGAVTSFSTEGKRLIKEYDLTFLPSLLVSKDISEYWWMFDQIKNSFAEKQDYYIFKNPLPPYKDIQTGKLKGIVDITYLTDNSCRDCFNITQIKDPFLSLGVFIDNEKYVDISSAEGKNLISKYNITAVPTVILSEGISDYNSIREVLEQIGTFEDNKFILRELDKLNVKYNKLK